MRRPMLFTKHQYPDETMISYSIQFPITFAKEDILSKRWKGIRESLIWNLWRCYEEALDAAEEDAGL